MSRWTDEETSFLKRNPKMSVKEQAEHLGRTTDSVRAKRERLSIYTKKICVPERFSPEEKILRLHALMAQYNLKLRG